MSERCVYLMSYDHGGYVTWGSHFIDSLKSSVDWMEKYPKFKIGQDNESFCYDRYAVENPEIIEKLRELLSKYPGRFSIGSSTYGQPLSVFISEESNVRQLTEAIRANMEHLGTRPYVYTISEHALHSQIPQLLKQTGYQMAIMRTHFQMYGYNPTYDSAFGMWYGDDGTAIPCVPTYENQGAQFGATTMENYILTRWPKEWHEPIEKFEDQFGKYTPLLGSRYDDVDKRCEELTAHVEGLDQYKWVVLEDLPELYAPYMDTKDEYRPGPNEFVVRMPWGICGNKIFNDCRKGEVLVTQAERLSAAANLWGMEVDKAGLDEAWRNLLIAQHHDVQICGLQREADAFIGKSFAAAEKVKSNALEAIVAQMKKGDGSSVTVVNLSDKPKRELVETTARLRRVRANAFEAVCGTERVPCGYDVMSRHGEIPTGFRVRFVAEVPPMSAKVYTIYPAKRTVKVSSTYENGVLTTPDYQIVLGEGGIVSVKDIESGKTVIDNGAAGRLFAGFVENVDSVSTGKWFVHCKPLVAEAVYQGDVGGIPCRFAMTLKEGDSLIRCRASFEHNGERLGIGRHFDVFRENNNGFVHEEKLRFVMGVPFVGEVTGWRDRPFLVAQTNNKYVEGNYWAAVGNDALAMAVFNGGSMCLTREENDTLSIPLAYQNAYAWGEKCVWGTREHTFALRPVTGEFTPTVLHREALDYTYPLVVTEEEGTVDGTEELNFLPMETSGNVAVSAYYIKNGKTYLRVYEFAGADGTVTLQGYRLHICDLLEQETGECFDETVSVTGRQIRTFRVEKK